jgi:hypothetical protein
MVSDRLGVSFGPRVRLGGYPFWKVPTLRGHLVPKCPCARCLYRQLAVSDRHILLEWRAPCLYSRV